MVDKHTARRVHDAPDVLEDDPVRLPEPDDSHEFCEKPVFRIFRRPRSQIRVGESLARRPSEDNRGAFLGNSSDSPRS